MPLHTVTICVFLSAGTAPRHLRSSDQYTIKQNMSKSKVDASKIARTEMEDCEVGGRFQDQLMTIVFEEVTHSLSLHSEKTLQLFTRLPG